MPLTPTGGLFMCVFQHICNFVNKKNKQNTSWIFPSLSVPAKHGLIYLLNKSNWLLFMSTHSDWLSTGKHRHSYYFTVTHLLAHSTSGLQRLQLQHSRLRQISKNKLHPSLCNMVLLCGAVQ